MTPKYKIGDVVVTKENVYVVVGITQQRKQERCSSGVEYSDVIELVYNLNGAFVKEWDILGTIEVKKV